ncbi:MAG TPA: hypothetical protein VN704_04860 [Verrucomicrobiae bacterium]|nr:hypothetical protein [Verrucomicrobiae bacterium]
MVSTSSLPLFETKAHIHSAYEKSIIERTIQYIKDRTENFDDYFPCRMKNCKLKHVTNWLKLFAHFYNYSRFGTTDHEIIKMPFLR